MGKLVIRLEMSHPAWTRHPAAAEVGFKINPFDLPAPELRFR